MAEGSDFSEFSDKVRNWGRSAKNTLLDVKDAAPFIAKQVAKDFVGDSPSEWAFNAALLPVSGLRAGARALGMGASALTRDQEAQGMLATTAFGQVPSRLERLYKSMKGLVAGGEGHSVWDASKGAMTTNPEGVIELAYRPKVVDLSRITHRPTSVSDVVKMPEAFAENPTIKDIMIAHKEMPGNKWGRYSADSGVTPLVDPGIATINKHLVLNDAQRAREVIGHEVGAHGVARHRGNPNWGADVVEETKRTAEAVTKLQGIYKYLPPEGKKEAEFLMQQLKKPGAGYDSYARRLDELHGQASGHLWTKELGDPYKGSAVSKVLNLRPGSPIRMESNPLRRLRTPSSPIHPNDLDDVINQLRNYK